MAKRKRPGDLGDFNIDDDFDLSNELGDLGNDYDMESDSPNSKSREPASKSIRKFGKGFTDSAKEMISLDQAANIAKKALPRSLKTELGDLEDLSSSVRDQYRESVKEIKTVGRTTVANLDKLIPNKGMFRNVLEKLKNKLGDEESNYGEADKSAHENETIANALGEIFTENHKAERVQELVRQSIENKRHKTSTDLLATIASETEQSRKFNFEIANNFYRRSLELQYRSLFIAKEHLDVSKAAVTGFKGQFETIVHNTALPDILKYKGTEMVKETLSQNVRDQLAETFFSDANPLTTLKKNLIAKMQQTTSDFKEGLSTTNDLLDTVGSTGEMAEMAGGKSYLLGKMLGEFGRDKLLGMAGNKLGKTAKGKNAVYNVKTAMADTSGYFNSLANSDLGEGVMGDLKRSLYTFLGDMSNTNTTNDTAFRKDDLDAATMFDIRTKDSINKVIPGLLSNIYSEVKGIRTGKFTPDEDATTFDHAKGVFTTSKAYENHIKSAIKTSLKDGTEYYINSLVDKLVSDGGAKFTKKEISDIQKGIFKYIIDGGSVSATALTSEKFLKYFNTKLAGKLEQAGSELLSMSKHDPSYLDSLQSDLKGIKESIPNINQKLQKLYSGGLSKIGVNLGGMSYNDKREQYVYNKKGTRDLLTSLYDDISKDSKGSISRRDKTSIDTTDVDFGEYLKELKESILDKGRKTRKVMTPSGFKEVLDDKGLTEKYGKVKDAVTTKADEYKKKYDETDFRAKYGELKTGAENLLDGQKEEIHAYLKEKYPGIDDVTIETIYAAGKKKHKELRVKGKILKRNSVKEFHALEAEVAKKYEALSKTTREEYIKTKRSTLKTYAKAKRQINKKLTSKEFAKLREQFYSTPEYVNGKMVDLDKWLQSQNYDTTNIKEFNVGGMANDVVGLAKTSKDKVLASQQVSAAKVKYEEAVGYVKTKAGELKKPDKEKIKQNLVDRFGAENVEKAKTLIEKLKVTRKKSEQAIIVEALDTIAEQHEEATAVMDEIKAEQKRKSRFGKLGLGSRISKAHSLDRTLLKGGFGLLGKALGFGIKSPWLLGKYGAKGLKRGYDMYKSDGVQNALGNSRSIDKKLFGMIPSLLGGTLKMPFKLAGMGARGLHSGGKWLFGNPEEEEKPKKNIFDTDNSGERDGSWKDRLKLFGRKPKEAAKEPVNKEDKKSSGLWGMLAAAIPLITTVLGKILTIGGKLISVLTGLPGMIMKLIPAMGKLLGASKGVAGAVTLGAAAVGAGKRVLGIGATAAAGAEVAGAATAAAKPGKIMTALNSFKQIILKKLGPIAGARMVGVLAAKIAARAVPFAGQALLAYDAAKITMLMIGGMSFASAVSTQILGADLFNNDEAVLDENGEPVKPDENLDMEKINRNNQNSTGDKGIDIEREKRDSNQPSFFDKLKESIKEKATTVKNKVVDTVSSGYNAVKTKVNDMMNTGTFNNGALGTSKEQILSMLDRVAEKTGVKANVLKLFAAIESGLNPNVTVGTSSASGLFQFLKGTWQDMLSKYGSKYGIGAQTSPFDAEANATMGAEFLKENSKAISGIKPNPSVTDLYLAHFLGAGGAKKFLKADPSVIAAEMMPAEAKANPNIFYRKDKTPKTIGEIYSDMDSKMYNKAIAFGFTPATTETDASTTSTTPTNGLDAAKAAAGNAPIVNREPANNTNYKTPETNTQVSDTGSTINTNDAVSPPKPVVAETTLSQTKPVTTTSVSDTASANLIGLTSETNSALGRIDKTLLQSLDTQTRMAVALEKLVSNFDRNLEMAPKQSLREKEQANTISNRAPNMSSSNVPDPAVSVSRNMYGS